MVPNLSLQNLECVETGKEFMLKHGYIKNDFDVRAWAAPEFVEQAAKDLIEEKWKKTTAPEAARGDGAADRVEAYWIRILNMTTIFRIAAVRQR